METGDLNSKRKPIYSNLIVKRATQLLYIVLGTSKEEEREKLIFRRANLDKREWSGIKQGASQAERGSESEVVWDMNCDSVSLQHTRGSGTVVMSH